MVAIVNISVIEGREYLVTAPAGVTVKYNNEVVTSTFIAVATANQVLIISASTITGNVTITEILRSYYEAYDQQGGVWAYPVAVDKWSTQYSFRPEWMSMVANRLVTFKAGKPYIHTGAYNTFFGQLCDTCLAIAHSEAGNTVKSYKTIAIEGDTPDRVHVRTEVPYVQSTDLISSDFTIKEGVNYSEVYRDRLSPNATGSYEDKLYKGDTIRGELCKSMVVYTQPQGLKAVKFVDIDFDSSTGQTV
jgi:hypothetical protein